MIFEYGAFKRVIAFATKTTLKNRVDHNEDELAMDDDVLAEKESIQRMTIEELRSQTMVMENVSKFYGRFRNRFCAVNDVSLSIKR